MHFDLYMCSLVCAIKLTIFTVNKKALYPALQMWLRVFECSFTIKFLRWIFCKHLFADLVECVWAAVRVAEFHVNGVVEQSQAAARLQDSVDFFEKAWPVKPVEGRHGCHQVHWAVSERQLLSHTLSEDGTITDICSMKYFPAHINDILYVEPEHKC